MEGKKQTQTEKTERKKLSSRKNYLLRANKIQEIYRAHKIEDMPDSVIHRKHIYPVYFISLASFRELLNVNVRGELRKIGIGYESVL